MFMAFDAHANEDTETNGYQPFNDQEAWHHSFSSNRGFDQSGQELDISDNDQEDMVAKEQFPEDSFLRMGRFRTRKPGKKAMIPRKDAMIFARNKGSDLWYLYRYLGKGTKNTKASLKNPWFNVQAEDGSKVGFWENQVDWMYGTSDLAPVSIDNYVT